jgi:hypothetical protein
MNFPEKLTNDIEIHEINHLADQTTVGRLPSDLPFPALLFPSIPLTVIWITGLQL